MLYTQNCVSVSISNSLIRILCVCVRRAEITIPSTRVVRIYAKRTKSQRFLCAFCPTHTAAIDRSIDSSDRSYRTATSVVGRLYILWGSLCVSLPIRLLLARGMRGGLVGRCERHAVAIATEQRSARWVRSKRATSASRVTACGWRRDACATTLRGVGRAADELPTPTPTTPTTIDRRGGRDCEPNDAASYEETIALCYKILRI